MYQVLEMAAVILGLLLICYGGWVTIQGLAHARRQRRFAYRRGGWLQRSPNGSVLAPWRLSRAYHQQERSPE